MRKWLGHGFTILGVVSLVLALACSLEDSEYTMIYIVAAVLSFLADIFYTSDTIRQRFFRKPRPCPPLADFRVDLATYRCGEMIIGAPLASGNAFFSDISGTSEIKDEKQGFEIGAKDGCLDYVFIDLEHFPGIITRNGKPLPHLRRWDVRRVISELGEPCRRDEHDDETLLFYENGYIELQIEFPEKRTVRFITIMRDPSMFEPLPQYNNSSVPLAGLSHLNPTLRLCGSPQKTSCPSCRCVRHHRPLPRSAFHFRTLKLPNFRTSPC